MFFFFFWEMDTDLTDSAFQGSSTLLASCISGGTGAQNQHPKEKPKITKPQMSSGTLLFISVIFCLLYCFAFLFSFLLLVYAFFLFFKLYSINPSNLSIASCSNVPSATPARKRKVKPEDWSWRNQERFHWRGRWIKRRICRNGTFLFISFIIYFIYYPSSDILLYLISILGFSFFLPFFPSFFTSYFAFCFLFNFNIFRI